MILKKTSLKGRLLVVILLTSFICVSLTTVAITYFGIENIRGKMVKDLDFTAKIIGDRVATNIQFLGFEEDANKSLESAPLNIRQICLYNRDGLYTYKIREDKKNKVCPSIVDLGKNLNSSKFTPDSLQTYKEIKFKGKEVVGYIFVESDLGEIKGFINDQLLTAAIVILGASILSYIIAITMQGSISKPILHLVDTTRKVSEERDYTIRADNFLQGDDIRKNEIAVLIDAFNSMLAEIEERRQLLLKNNQELIKARDAAESANRAKSQFLANISHELRTPLNAVIGFSDIIMKEMLGPVGNAKYLEYSKDINESGEHLLHIVNDIFDLFLMI
jgi:methyl-accepting chemotaxis protein